MGKAALGEREVDPGSREWGRGGRRRRRQPSGGGEEGVARVWAGEECWDDSPRQFLLQI